MPAFKPVPPAAFKMPLTPFEPFFRPFNFYTQPHPAAIVKRNGHYVRVYAPTWEELDVLEEGTDHFAEGREYTVTTQVASDLTADGFGEYIT